MLLWILFPPFLTVWSQTKNEIANEFSWNKLALCWKNKELFPKHMPERIYQVSAAHREKVIGKVEDCLLVFHKGSTSTWQLKNGNCIHMHFISCLETRIDTLGARWEKGEKVGEGECKTNGEWMQKELWSIKSCYILYSSHLCISMKPSCEKLHFWGTSDAFLMPGCVILLGINWGKEAKGNKKKKEGGGGKTMGQLSRPTHQSPGPPGCVR